MRFTVPTSTVFTFSSINGAKGHNGSCILIFFLEFSTSRVKTSSVCQFKEFKTRKYCLLFMPRHSHEEDND